MKRKGKGQQMGVDKAEAGSRYTKELDFVHRAPPFVSVALFFRSD